MLGNWFPTLFVNKQECGRLHAHSGRPSLGVHASGLEIRQGDNVFLVLSIHSKIISFYHPSPT